MSYLNPEIIGIAISIAGALVGASTWLYKNVGKPILKVLSNHDELAESISYIKKELTTNGGSSIKDVIYRIEDRQIIVDHRTKAIFNNFDKPLIEVGKNGKILWANEKFYNVCGNRNLQGLDWIGLIDEPNREALLKELESCVEKNRELVFQTMCMDSKPVTVYGYPYREEESNHGFLIHFKKGE